MRKIGYLGIVAVTVYLCIMYDGNTCMYLLAFELLMALMLYISSWYLKAHLKVNLNVQIPVVEKNQEFPVEVWMENTGWLPMSRVRVTLGYDSEYTRKSGKSKLETSVGFKKWEPHKKNYTMRYAGRYYFYVTEVRIYDALGLFSRKLNVRDNSTFVNVLPTIQELPLEIDPKTRQYMPDSDEYATDKRGDDVSEIYAIREYRPGDSLKAIHWKLSARTEHWMVKEFSFPQGVQILILLDFYTLNTRTFGEERLDALLGSFASLSYSLALKGVSHVAAWYDDAEGELLRCRISNEEGTYAMVDQLLEAVPYGWQYDIEAGYGKEYPGEQFAVRMVLDTELTLRYKDQVLMHFGEKGHEQQVII